MVNKNCQYRKICGHSDACYDNTRKEEEWCPYAKDLAQGSIELELEHWNSLPMGNDGLQVGRDKKLNN